MRFSQFPSQPGCNQEYASGLQQGLNDEVAPIIAQAEALVLQQPTERALDRPAVSAQAKPGHLYPHVPRQMARTSRAMTMEKRSQPSSKHLISWNFMAVSEMCASRRACPSHPPPAVEARMAGTRPTACTDLGNDPLRPCLIPSWPGSSGPSIQGRGED